MAKNRVYTISNLRETEFVKGLKKENNPAKKIRNRKIQTTLASYRKPIQKAPGKFFSPTGTKTR
jgi:hypothetical protein